MAYTTQYIGSRYVPLFAEPAEWDSTRTYEPLTIVMHDGNSYTSRQYVPVGIKITNEKFWALTGNYNAQVDAYRHDVQVNTATTEEYKTKVDGAIDTMTDKITQYKSDIDASEQQYKSDIDASEQNFYNQLNTEFGSVIPLDSAPIENSTKGVTSGGVYNTIAKMDGRVTANTQAIANITKYLEYVVGPNQKYTTITSAVNAANSKGGNAFIFIEPGTYNESINMYNYTNCDSYTFFASSLGSVIWKSDTHYGYNYPCINVAKSVYCENIVFIKGNDALIGSGNGGYAVHQDSEYSDCTAIYTNCKMVSYENAAFGCGTRTNNDVKLLHCHLISYKNNNHHGALLYHSGPKGTTGEKLTLIGNTVQGLGDDCYGCSIYKAVGSEGIDSEYVFINNFISGKQVNDNAAGISVFNPTDNVTTWKSSPSTWYGNNLIGMNAADSPITGPLGYGNYRELDTPPRRCGFYYHSDNRIGLGFRLNSAYGVYFTYNPITGKSRINNNGDVRDIIGFSQPIAVNYFSTNVIVIGCIAILNFKAGLPASGTMPDSIKPKYETVISGSSSDGSVSTLTLKIDGTYTVDKTDKTYCYNAVYMVA